MNIDGKWTVAWPGTTEEDWQIREDGFGTFSTYQEAVSYARKVLGSYIKNYVDSGKAIGGNYQHEVWQLFCGWDWTQSDMISCTGFRVGQVKVPNTLSDIQTQDDVPTVLDEMVGHLPVTPGTNSDDLIYRYQAMEKDIDTKIQLVMHHKYRALHDVYRVINIDDVAL